MTNLTDAELALIDAEHYPHPDGGGDCLSCRRVWPCLESRAIAELRLLRGALERLADDNTRRGLTSSQLSWARYVLLGGLAAWEGES